MKNYFIYIFAIVSSLFIFSACDSFLTQDNPNNVVSDDEWWETEENATAALQSAYAGIPHGTDGRNAMLISSLSDESVSRQSHFGNYEEYTKSLQTSDWGVALHIWRDNYRSIRRANRFLDNAHRIFMKEDLKERYIHEALALRAYYHMESLMLFGPLPIQDRVIDPNDNFQARNTEEECYNFVLDGLIEASKGLPDKYIEAEKERISRPACWALITRLAMFYHKYDLAAEYSKKIIDTDRFELFSDYSKLFTYAGEQNQEEIMIKKMGAYTAWLRFAPKSIGGQVAMSPTNVVVNNFETKQGKTIWELTEAETAQYIRNPNLNNNRDPRLSATVLLPGDVYDGQFLDPFSTDPLNADRVGAQQSTATGFWVKKYLDPLDRHSGRKLRFMNIRYAEILLTYAEALIERGDWADPDVIKYINMVRQRAKMPVVDQSVYNNQEKLRELVRRERQAELALEGQRMFDIRRWGIAEKVMNGHVYGATNSVDGQTYRVETRAYRPNRDVRYPIPRAEITANKNLKQNPGY